MPDTVLVAPSTPSIHRSAGVSDKIEWLHGLRGIAAFLVVFTHARYFFLGTPSWPEVNAALLPTAMGVDLFFVISGFIMTLTAIRGHYSGPLDFGIKRFARVWPPYACITLVWMMLFNQAGFESLQGLIPVLKSLLFIPADPRAPLYFSVTMPLGWTLEFEAYFYLVFAACLLLKGRLRWLALIGWVLFSTVAFPLLRHGFHVDPLHDPGYSWGYANLMTNPMVLEFLYGVLIALLYVSRVRIADRRLCLNLMFGTLACALWYCFCVPGAFHGPAAWGAAAGLIVLVLAIGSKTVNIAVPAVISWLGTISYSLYLTHMITHELLIRLLRSLQLETHSWGFVFLTTCLVLVAAYFFHVTIERWLSDRLRNGLLALCRRRKGIGSSHNEPIRRQA